MTNSKNAEHFFDVAVVGAGQGGVHVATELLKLNFGGTIGLFSAESVAPYERPPLSKGYFSGEQAFEDITFKGSGYWDDSPIELLLGRRIVSVDPAAKTITSDGGEVAGYAHLVWAAGGAARTLPIPGHDLAGVHTVRNLDDADALRLAAETANAAVIIGGGYIGLEAASALRGLGIDVTVVEAADRLLGRVTSPEISEFYRKLHVSHGVRVLLDAGVKHILGRNGEVSGVELASGEVLPAQIVIVGVGIIPNTAPLHDAGAAAGNGVEVDGFCRTTLPDVWAVGDCANHENRYAAGARMRIESVQNASEQARVVAADIVGQSAAYDAVPWFWSNQYDVKLKTVGLLGGYTDIVIRGDVQQQAFSALYLRDGELLAMDCVNRPRDFAEGKHLMGSGARLDPDAAADPARSLRSAVLEPVA